MKSQNRRMPAFISLLIVTPLGFATKFYGGPGAWWLNNYAGGVLYEIFWCLAVVFLWPNTPFVLTAVFVFVSTCSLEFLQLWNPYFLQALRGTFIGRTIIGTSFSWWDFPHYLVGCLAGWFWIKSLGKTETRRKETAPHESNPHNR